MFIRKGLCPGLRNRFALARIPETREYATYIDKLHEARKQMIRAAAAKKEISIEIPKVHLPKRYANVVPDQREQNIMYGNYDKSRVEFGC